MYQQITIMGYLGQDPEMRYMPDGRAVTNFSVATSRKWNNADGERQDETTWFRCSVWGKSAEAVQEYFSKGKPILVSGRIKPDRETGGPRMFERQDGSLGTSFEVDVFAWSFLPGGDTDGEDYNSRPSGKKQVTEEDEIPF